MKNKNTRRGNTQKIVNKNCHSRMSLSGISTTLRWQKADPRQKPSGMTLHLIPPHPAFGHPLQRGSTCLQPPYLVPAYQPCGTAAFGLAFPHKGDRTSGIVRLVPQGARKTTHGFTARSVTPQCRYAGYSGRPGFTLIELLVVVLIIGILAAVAVPQYQKAVEKSKAVQAMVFTKIVGQAAHAYYLEHGTPFTSFNQLDLSLTDAQREQFLCGSIDNSCGRLEWGISTYNAANNLAGVVVWRTSGPYKGGGFAMYYEPGRSHYQTNTLYCIVRFAGPNKATKNYCKELFNGEYVSNSNNSHHYLLP